MTKCGPILDRVKQEVFKSVSIDIAQTTAQMTDAARELERRVAHLERENASLHDENDAQEQKRIAGGTDAQVDTDNAVLSVANEKLGLSLTRDCIDRSHRLGQAQSTSNGKPRPIIVKLTSKARRTYTRLCVFTTQLDRREQTRSRLDRVHCHDAIQTWRFSQAT